MNRLRAIFLAPAAGITIFLFLIPLSIIISYSFLTRGVYGGVAAPWTFENYQRLFDPLYGVILWRSLVMSVAATALCLLIAFPLALFIARADAKWKSIYLYLVILPFWTSFLVRTYAWMFLLRDSGLINSILLSLKIINEPLPLLYNETAVVVGLVYGYLPFAVLPLFSNLDRLDKNLLEAAADLGATPWQTLRHVVIPLCAPGLRAAGVLVFIPCLGAYLTPDLLGGGKSIMIGNLIQNQFTTARDWPFGSAISLALMALVMILLTALLGRDGEEIFMKQSRFLPVFAALVYAFLHVPLLILCAFSFNSSKFTIWEGFSLEWYRLMFNDTQLAEATGNSLVIAVVSTFFATVIGTLCAYGLWKRNSKWLSGSLYLSLVTPEIVTGISLLALFQWIFRYWHVQLGMHTVILAHVAFAIAYVLLVVMARLRTAEPALEDAALDLGATEWQAFRLVTLPILKPGIAAAALLAFTVSFDDYVITSLVAGVDSETLPMVLYAMARRGANPVVSAISTVIFFGFGLLILLSERMQKNT